MNEQSVVKRHIDYTMLLAVVGLIVLGIVMIYSASAVFAQEKIGDSYFFLKKTLLFAALGFGLMFGATRLPYDWYKKKSYWILGGSIVLLLLVIFSPLGITIGGARRWLRVGIFSFQPSEFAKLALVVFLAYSLEKKIGKIKTFTLGFLFHSIVCMIFIGLVFFQKDFGAAFVLGSIAWLMMFTAGVRWIYLFAMFLTALPIIYYSVLSVGYRKQRILSFLNPWEDQYGSGFQMIQSFVAFSEGGFFGKGLGDGRQKLFYLPEAHTDFIFSVIGEELGLIGVVAVILLFTLFIYRGTLTAIKAPDKFGKFLAIGITLIVGLQAILNFGVVMGLLPTKGMVLPFISYGGSALLVSMLASGILLNISSYRKVVW
ncbi:putative lipid II flippase FtsW [bacterium]|nr:putative lipid II flippase FtsW [bacterium]